MYSLVDKVLSGTATQEEIAELQKWIAKHPSNQDDYDDMKLLWKYSHLEFIESNPHFYDGLDRIKGIITQRESKFKPANLWRHVVIALLIAVGISMLLLTYRIVMHSYFPTTEKVISLESRLSHEIFLVIREISDDHIVACQ